MTTILITRPAGAAESFARALEREGYRTAIEPLLIMHPLAAPRPPPAGIDAVMITSGNALAALENRPQDRAALAGLPCFCVGPRTADKARAAGFGRVYNSDGDGETLARYIGKKLGARPATILHIAGSHADRKIYRPLEERGHRLQGWPVYDMHAAARFTPPTLALFDTGAFDAVTFFSPRTAEVFAALLAQHAREACCAGLAAICLSEAVADVLNSIAWRHRAVAALPTEESLIARLAETCPVKTT